MILVQRQTDIVTITLNRPEVRNALNQQIILELTAQLQTINSDPTVRAVILRSTGEHFCAGADLKWIRECKDFSIFAKLLRTLNFLDKPTISITQGAVYGGAVGIVACCDLSIALDTTEFCCSEVKLGLAPAIVGPYIVAAIGVKNARRWLLTAEKFNSAIAQQLGLVHHIAKNPAELDTSIEYYINLLLQNGPQAVAATKKFLLTMPNVLDPNIDQYTTKLLMQLRDSAEGQEGIARFLEG